MVMTEQQLEDILRRMDAATPGTLEVVERDSVWRDNEWLAEFLRPADAELFAHAREYIDALLAEVNYLQVLLKRIHDDWQAGILPPIPNAARPYPLMTMVTYLLRSRSSLLDKDSNKKLSHPEGS